ncbi:hypothetical protein K505DRAFT_357793 [Melanomma pulvis-pyrius CBS 109.77]|uniref:Uncharacterized protein n=1 Tax=Melanomma pulvis-pyrius CBS 109.77 TaxID=1314802 RepID=A0A6A6XNR6_9PLEO|nr:hypothetical protein K505DRAFT_357793 [Melanomma pulvis-pyrius CBS 109.77]
MESNIPKQPPYQAIIWLNMEDDLEPIEENTKLSIRTDSVSKKQESPWFLSANVRKLKRKLGSSYADTNRGLAMLHQNIVLMEVLEKSHKQNVIYAQDANDAINESSKIRNSGRNEGTNNEKKVLAFMHHNQVVHAARFAKMYDRMTHNVDEFYPTRDENIWEQNKIHDIRILDQIAKREKQWRPTTCECIEGRKCPLAKEEKTIYKRTNSCAGGHVIEVSKNQLKCGPGKPQSPAVATPTTENEERIHALDDMYGRDYYTWFHQTFVEDLQKCEIRVFIATRRKESEPVMETRKRKAKNPRVEEQENENTREPYIVQIVDTRFLENENEDRVVMTAKSIEKGFTWPMYPNLTYDMVEKFALDMYGLLRETKAKGFDSLEVGVRLDLGVAKDGTSLWVNEITRWYTADFFADETGTFEKIPKAYAKAFAEVYPTPKREALDSDGPNSKSRRKRRKVN